LVSWSRRARPKPRCGKPRRVVSAKRRDEIRKKYQMKRLAQNERKMKGNDYPEFDPD
jgi:hypothetical protein